MSLATTTAAPSSRSRRATATACRSPGLRCQVKLARPTDKRADRAFTLGERTAGRYSGDAADVAAGIWDLEVEADRGGERLFRSKNRITLD